MSCQLLQLAEVDAVASEIVVCVACSRILVCYRDEKACVLLVGTLMERWRGGQLGKFCAVCQYVWQVWAPPFA